MINLTDCTTNAEVKKVIKKAVQDTDLDWLMTKCDEVFVFHRETVKSLYYALAAGENIILYGPGGFGKSLVVDFVLDTLGIPRSTKVGYKGMQPEELFGLPNMKKLMEESDYEIAFDKSVFVNPGCLVLEEFLDADPSTGAALKDILSQGGMRDKMKFTESLISSVIICSNKSPEDFSSNDDSLKAFYEDRFPIRLKVQWESFDKKNYLSFLKVYFPKRFSEFKVEMDVLATICASSRKTISPRLAAKAGNMIINNGLESLSVITDLDTQNLTELIEHGVIKNRLLKQETLLIQIEKEVDQQPLTITGYVKLNEYLSLLGETCFDDELMFSVETLSSKMSKLKDACLENTDLSDTMDNIKEQCNELDA
jgi:energy-coupling factor transporter ATP-binding protein EcfA2